MSVLIPQLRAMTIPKRDAVIVCRCPADWPLYRRFQTDREMEALLSSMGIEAKVITIPATLTLADADDAQLAAAGLVRGALVRA